MPRRSINFREQTSYEDRRVDQFERNVAEAFRRIEALVDGGDLTGPQGASGDPGAVWREGTGAPDNDVGRNGDFWLDDLTGDVYQKVAGSYIVVANIKGPTGATGATGPAGAAGKDGATGATGATGPAGAAGKDGATGATGAAGAPGSVWYEGTGAPAGGLGINGDFYLNDANGNVYQKAAGSWSIVANILGPTGATGATGATGSTGPAGAAGKDGATGATGPAGSQIVYTQAITANVSVGWSGSSPTYTVSGNWAVLNFTSNNHWDVTLKNTNAPTDAIVEVRARLVGEVGLEFFDEADGSLGSLFGITDGTNPITLHCKFINIAGSGWRHLDRGDLDPQGSALV